MLAHKDILNHLHAHATASWYFPELGFYDRAAEIIFDLLNGKVSLDTETRWHREIIERSQWIDSQCLEYFRRHPKALCIEISAGISTRFHRLSEMADWPQFSWIEFSTPDLCSLKQSVLPKIDNYQNCSIDTFSIEHIEHIHQKSTQPLIVIIESEMIQSKPQILNTIFSAPVLGTLNKPVTLILEDKSPNISKKISNWFNLNETQFVSKLISLPLPKRWELNSLRQSPQGHYVGIVLRNSYRV